MYRVKQAGFSVTFQRDDPFEIADTPENAFVLKCIRGAMEYDWDTGGQIKQYEEIVE
jgi:hypothetical protein